mgnify:CR=1 FL=1
MATLTEAIQAWRGPWMSGMFRQELREALQAMLATVTPKHDFLAGELDMVFFDKNLDPDDLDLQDPEKLLKLLKEDPSNYLDGVDVHPIPAPPRLDRQLN